MSHVAKREGLFFLIPSGTAKGVRKEASCSLTIDCEVAVSMVTGFFFSCSAAKCSNNKKKFVAKFGLQVGYLYFLRFALGSLCKDRT